MMIKMVDMMDIRAMTLIFPTKEQGAKMFYPKSSHPLLSVKWFSLLGSELHAGYFLYSPKIYN